MTRLTITEANMLRDMVEKAINGALNVELLTRDGHNIKIHSDGSDEFFIGIKQCLEDADDD